MPYVIFNKQTNKYIKPIHMGWPSQQSDKIQDGRECFKFSELPSPRTGAPSY